MSILLDSSKLGTGELWGERGAFQKQGVYRVQKPARGKIRNIPEPVWPQEVWRVGSGEPGGTEF